MADKMRLEYLLSGSQIDTFITSHLSAADVQNIGEALEESMRDQGASSTMVQTFQMHLEDTCAQDLCEQGESDTTHLLPERTVSDLLHVEVQAYHGRCLLRRTARRKRS